MNDGTGKRVTISDVAKMAGVSKATVSRYLNGRFNLMSEETRHRIETVIAFSHYRPSATARSLKTQRSNLVGVIIADISSPFSASLIKGADSVFSGEGYVPVFVDTNDSLEREEASVRSLLSHQVDGLLVNTASTHNPQLIDLANSGFPVVLCDREVRDFNFDIVTADYKKPIFELFEHLISQGYGRIGICTQEFETNSVRTDRVDAFKEASRRCLGVTDPERNVLVVRVSDAESVRSALGRFVEETPAGTVPAVIGVNSVTLTSAYHALWKMGLSMPDEVGLCGPDDWDWSRHVAWDWPEVMGVGITTFKTKPTQLGAQAAWLLLRRIHNPDASKERVLLPAELTVRRSTMLSSRGDGPTSDE